MELIFQELDEIFGLPMKFLAPLYKRIQNIKLGIITKLNYNTDLYTIH